MRRYPAMSWLDPRIEVRSSAIEGKGLFAKEPIKAGEVVLVCGGEVLPATALETIKARPKYSSFFISDDLIIVLRDDDPVTFGNHSCDPNLWMHDEVSEEARRDILPGEELTVDYALHTDDASWSMPCRCGSPICRHVVKGDDWRLPELQRRYAGHFSPFINERIRRLRMPKSGQ
jgi:SET domain-containing protein